jgi:hypothetical protein
LIYRHEIVDDDRRPAGGLYVPVLLGVRHAVAAEVDRAELGVVAERRRHDVRPVVGSGGGEPAQDSYPDVGFSPRPCFHRCPRALSHL